MHYNPAAPLRDILDGPHSMKQTEAIHGALKKLMRTRGHTLAMQHEC